MNVFFWGPKSPFISHIGNNFSSFRSRVKDVFVKKTRSTRQKVFALPTMGAPAKKSVIINLSCLQNTFIRLSMVGQLRKMFPHFHCHWFQIGKRQLRKGKTLQVLITRPLMEKQLHALKKRHTHHNWSLRNSQHFQFSFGKFSISSR